ncbi:MAG TPA: hypothetical protein VHK89_07930 [Actinomycetota bacterium]|nr:hypothetical protein [Actinomycetota bacterium]
MVVPTPSSFERARARGRRKRVLATLVGRGSRRRLPELGSVVPRPWALTDVGRRLVPVRSIVGTVEGTRDFDRDFLPRKDLVRERWRALEDAFEYASFPPVELYEADGAYFVLDGHHRVAIARQWGIDALEADVTRVRSLASRSR